MQADGGIVLDVGLADLGGTRMSRGETRIATGSLTTVCVRRQPDGSIKAIPIPSEIADRFEVAASAST